MRLWPAIALAACAHRAPEPVAVPAEGIAIAVYADDSASLAVVDDRRWVEVTGRSILFDRIEPAAALPSLVIEPLAGGRLTVGSCMRERLDEDPAPPRPPTVVEIEELFDRRAGGAGERVVRAGNSPGVPPQVGVVSPLVRCAVTGAPGRYLVRVLYVVGSLGFRTQHDVAMTADRATVATRFAFTTPRWKARAELVLHDGLPGRDEPPRELARGPITLDGGVALLVLPPREVGARLRTIYDGMAPKQSAEPTDLVWGKDSQQSVWVWLELDGLALPRGPVHVHVEPREGGAARDADVAAEVRDRDAGSTRLPVWIDPTLRGMRQRWVDHADGATLADRFQLSVSNLGDAPREVWIEERLRPARRREIARGWPQKPALAGKVARSRILLAPGAIERVGFTIRYDL